MTPHFNAWTVIFLIAAAQGFFISVVLWRWAKGIRQANRLLAVLVFLFSLSMVEYVLYWTNYMLEYPYLTNVSVNFPFLYGSLIWLYLRTVFENKSLRWQDCWHLLPPLLASLPFLQWYLMPASEKRSCLGGHSVFHAPGIIIQFWARMIHMAIFAGWNTWYIWKQPRTGDTARWARMLVVFQVVFGLAYTSYFILVRFPFFNNLWDYHISAIMTVMIYAIAWAGYMQPDVFNGMTLAESGSTGKYRNSGLTSDASRTLLQNLLLLMEQEKLYRDPEFSLDKLAGKLQASKHHVSQVINEMLGITFFEYINQLRIRDACAMLAETTRSDMHIIEIAYAVGFNTKMSFNAAFKRSTGMTPTEYRMHHGMSDNVGLPPREAQ